MSTALSTVVIALKLNICVHETSRSVSFMRVGYSKDIFWTISEAVCVYAARVYGCFLYLCVQSILASDRGALWDGRSLTPTVVSKQRRANVSGPAHCTDTLLVSVVSQAEQGRERERETHTQRHRQ